MPFEQPETGLSVAELASEQGGPKGDFSSHQGWWHRPGDFCAQIERQVAWPPKSIFYQFGGAVLEVETDDARLCGIFAQMYGDCAVPEPVVSASPLVSAPSPGSARPPEGVQENLGTARRFLVRCVVRRAPDMPLLLITFLEGGPADPAQAFLPIRAMRVWDSSVCGWRMSSRSQTPMLAARGAQVLIDEEQAWGEFPVEYLVNATLTAQSGLVAVHAASLQIGGAGLLLIGPSHAGKTTTALHLAARGISLLGDEVALVDLAHNEILPFRRTANLRSGPRGAELEYVVDGLHDKQVLTIDNEAVTRLQIGKLFPEQQPARTRLAAAFFLDGFSDCPSVRQLRPELGDLQAFGVLAGNEIATLWGMPASRRALRLLAIRHLLGRVPCWRLKVGMPDATAALIEMKMENL